jgi:antitoxin component of RelBE/YafQ-DinJ toxin-antitoxin module
MKKLEGKKRKLPSRERYEKANPTVSVRVPEETRAKLLEVVPKLGMSLADAFKVLVGELEFKAIPIDEARRQGYEEAKKLYAVTYLCFICGKPIVITSPETKKVVSKFLTTHGWGHNKCIEQMGRT